MRKEKITPKYMSPQQIADKLGYFPIGGLRHLLHTNKVFRRRVSRQIGTKILIDVSALEKWIDEQHYEK
jgi:hypothetical protein